MSGSRASGREIEIKLAVASPAEGRRLLRRAGLRVTGRRAFEVNLVFDTARGTLRRARSLLRVRETGGRGLLTYKGPATAVRYKSREEIESALDDPAAARLILERLGYRAVFRYEKFRTEFGDGSGAAALDETPIGCFLELEGEPAWIDRRAAAMGFPPEAYITASYLRLYLEDCRRRRRAPGNMVFPGGGTHYNGTGRRT
ncbi:MAG: class IV adenylate cyclase [Bryobacteraceae bacterium]